MLKELKDFAEIYDAVKTETYESNERKVTIFVSALEADSICALRILQGILKNDGVHHSIYPVTCYSEVMTIFASQLNDEEIKNVIFINLGACEDATEMLETQEGTRLLIIDSRRPINLNLAHTSSERALLVCEGDDVHPATGDVLPPADGLSDAGESDSEDQDPDVDKENVGPSNKRGRAEVLELGQTNEASRKERRKRRKKAARLQRKEYYEIGAFWGRPATLTLLRLAQDLHQADKHSYWLGAVALTDQLIHQRIAPERYAIFANELEMEIESAGGPEAEKEVQIRVETAEGDIINATAKNPVTRVTAGKEMRFALMRHWSLYEAMLHSTHVAVRLSTWNDKGRRKLEELLTKMGFKVKDCKLDFSEMRLLVHQQLEAKLEEYGHTAQLSDLVFQSFHLHWGYRAPLSATDAVYSISSLLESHATRPHEQLQPTEAFWRAWKALNPGNTDDMRHGLELGKQLQRAILTDGGLIVDRKDVRSNSKFFCWVDLTKSAVTNKTILSQPLALLKLGVFLRDQKKWRNPRKESQSFVVFGPATPDRTCLVVSIAKQPSINNIEGNNFPLMFRKAAEAAGCEIDFDGFDVCVGQVSADSIDRLVNEMAIAASGLS